MKIYFAGPLFSEAERDWIRAVKRRIEDLAAAAGRDVEVVWPYDLIRTEELTACGDHAQEEVFRRCRVGLEEADIIIAFLDGTQVDDGTAWEIGYFYRHTAGKASIIGIRTDFRSAGESKRSIVNAMIECSCNIIATSTEALLKELERLWGEVSSKESKQPVAKNR